MSGMSGQGYDNSDQRLGKRSPKFICNSQNLQAPSDKNIFDLEARSRQVANSPERDSMREKHLQRESKVLDFESSGLCQNKLQSLYPLRRGPDLLESLVNREAIFCQSPINGTTRNQNGRLHSVEEEFGESGGQNVAATRLSLFPLGEAAKRVESQLSYLYKAYQFLRFYFTKADTTCLTKLSTQLSIPKQTLELWVRERSFIISKAKAIGQSCTSNQKVDKQTGILDLFR